MVTQAYTPIEQMDWSLLVEADASEALAMIDQLRNLALLVISMTAGVVAVAAFVIARRMTHPLLAVGSSHRPDRF